MFSLLNQLDAWDRRQLGQFLASPFFNRRKDVIDLYDYLKTLIEKGPSKWKKNTCWEIIYPDQTYDDQKMRLLQSYLFRLMEQFLAFRQLKKADTTLDLHLGKAYRELKMGPNFQKTIDRLRNRIERLSFQEENFLHHRYELEYEYYGYLANLRRSGQYDLQPMANAFDEYFIAGKLKHACLQIAHQAIFKKEYETGLLNWVLDYVEQQPACLSNLAIAVYYYCYKAITGANDQNYFQLLRDWIETHNDDFNATELANICLLAINYCIRMLNTGQVQFVREGFGLYRLAIEKGFLFENDLISPFNYRNVASLGIMLGENEWVEHFIQQHAERLPIRQRASIQAYCLASLRYSQQRYGEAMRLLIRFDSEDKQLTVGAKMILVRIYFELGEYEPLESLLQSLQVYLNRNKGMGYQRQVYLQVIGLVRKLVAVIGKSKADRNKIRKEIETLRVQRLRNWLLERLDAMGR